MIIKILTNLCANYIKFFDLNHYFLKRGWNKLRFKGNIVGKILRLKYVEIWCSFGIKSTVFSITYNKLFDGPFSDRQRRGTLIT